MLKTKSGKCFRVVRHSPTKDCLRVTIRGHVAPCKNIPGCCPIDFDMEDGDDDYVSVVDASKNNESISKDVVEAIKDELQTNKQLYCSCDYANGLLGIAFGDGVPYHSLSNRATWPFMLVPVHHVCFEELRMEIDRLNKCINERSNTLKELHKNRQQLEKEIDHENETIGKYRKSILNYQQQMQKHFGSFSS